jgi:hypothetical protein
MQKLDFVKGLTEIIQKLNSDEITEVFSRSFAIQSDTTFNFASLTPLLFNSKSNYDSLIKDKELEKIIADFELDEIYTNENLAFIVKHFTQASPFNIFKVPQIKTFWGVHQALIHLLRLAKKQLLNDVFLQKNETQLNKGIIIFQIVIDGDGLDAGIYSEIFINLKELVSTITKINGQDNENAEIILLDSGSDTNVAIRTTAETAKSLFLIFKEMWDFFANFKFYKQKQQNQALMEGLTIMQEVKDKISSGLLTEEEGKEYLHYIKSRTDKLIGYKVMPKSIISENTTVDNIKLLHEMKEIRLLSSGQ